LKTGDTEVKTMPKTPKRKPLKQADNKGDALLKVLENASEDDEPFTDDDRAEEEEGWREYRQGLSRPWSEVTKKLSQQHQSS
jgi:hypothetical protein